MDWLSLIFSYVTVDDNGCWISDSYAERARHRITLWVNLHGPTQRKYELRADCGNKMCINPHHMKRFRETTGAKYRGVRYEHPDVDDRAALLEWYAAGNSPIRAIDVPHVQELLRATQTVVRPHARRKRLGG